MVLAQATSTVSGIEIAGIVTVASVVVNGAFKLVGMVMTKKPNGKSAETETILPCAAHGERLKALETAALFTAEGIKEIKTKQDAILDRLPPRGSVSS